jgi:hypothetical protein
MRHIYTHITTLVFAIGCTVLCALPLAASASVFSDIRVQQEALGGAEGANFDITDDPRLVATRVIRIATSLFGFVFFGYTVYGGSLIAFSVGREDEIKKGKSTIVTGVLGITIMLAAYSITQLVSDSLMVSLQRDACSNQSGPCFETLPDSTPQRDPLGSERDRTGQESSDFWGAVFGR